MQTTRLQIGRRAFLATGLAVAAAPTGSALSETPPVEDDAHRYRPVLHYAPRTGFMKDPNGLVFHDGEWHLFYQYKTHTSPGPGASTGATRAVPTCCTGKTFRSPSTRPRRGWPSAAARYSTRATPAGYSKRASRASSQSTRVLRPDTSLRPVLDRPAGLLSGGEQQMLALARGLLARPALLLLDEPSLGLAPAVAQELFEALSRMRDDGLTLLLVDQMTNLALPLADRCAVLAGGRIGRVGSVAEMAEALDYLGTEAAWQVA